MTNGRGILAELRMMLAIKLVEWAVAGLDMGHDDSKRFGQALAWALKDSAKRGPWD
jgi:hypothetical protein